VRAEQLLDGCACDGASEHRARVVADLCRQRVRERTRELDHVDDEVVERHVRAIPLEHRELGQVSGRALAVAKDTGDLIDAWRSTGDDALQREFRRRMQIASLRSCVEKCLDVDGERIDVRLESGPWHEHRRLTFEKALAVEKGARRAKRCGAQRQTLHQVVVGRHHSAHAPRAFPRQAHRLSLAACFARPAIATARRHIRAPGRTKGRPS
jgi:hypothetical protein